MHFLIRGRMTVLSKIGSVLIRNFRPIITEIFDLIELKRSFTPTVSMRKVTLGRKIFPQTVFEAITVVFSTSVRNLMDIDTIQWEVQVLLDQSYEYS